MASFNKFNSFVEALGEAKHDFSADTLTVALTASANAPLATNTQLSDLTVISYANLRSRVLANVTSTQTSGTFKLDADDLVLTASGTVATFRYIVVYNETSTDDLLIGWYDYGSNVTLLTGETFTINWDAAGILTVA